MRKAGLSLILALAALAFCGCGARVDVIGDTGSAPEIFPDYRDVTVPENIAPLNFSYIGEEKCVLLVGGKTIRPGKDNSFRFRSRLWRNWMRADSLVMTLAVRREGVWKAMEPFVIRVSRDRIDPWISYRLIPPGYQGWQDMGIYQRNLENYSQRAILTNDLTGGNCLNCHTYLDGDPSKMVFHARSDFGGTVIVQGSEVEKLNTKTDSTVSALVYPYWHPSGEYVAFSVNKTLQAFYNHDPNRIEVYDEASDVVVYNVKTHQIAWSPLTKATDRFETFPTFSPDGKWLYFCSARAVEDMPADHREVRYGLYRIAFNASDMIFGDSLECVYDAPAEGFSVSFPRVSPDGRYLCFTRHGYGNFSIWHKDADLWMLDLSDGSVRPMDEVNSDDVESFHTWSSNGRWLVFSSRRDDGLYTKPYFAHVDAQGRCAKPFLLPQKDPKRYYRDLMESYNLPAFMTGKVTVGKRRLTNTLRHDPGTDVQVR